jgi:hypothetical protein
MKINIKIPLKRIKRFIVHYTKRLKGEKCYYDSTLTLFKNKNGLEIGGPSAVFEPIYRISNFVDGVNHKETIWQGKITTGNYHYGTGKQYIADATTLSTELLKNSYDFILASHILEHIANPIKAITTWKKSLVDSGIIFLILPKKEYTFDHKRPITPIKVLVDKYKKNIGENDLSSLEEILNLHDLTLDKAAGNKEQFTKRSLDNYRNRCLHHHVFDFNLLNKMAKEVEMEVIYQGSQGVNQFIILENSNLS